MNDDRWRYFLQISTDIVKYARKILCPLRNYSLSKSCSKSYFSLQKSLPWWTEGDPFFYGTKFKINPLLVHFQGSNSPYFIWIKGSANFDLFFEMKGLFWSYFVNLLSANILRETPSSTSFQDKYWFEKKKILLKNQKSL